MSVPFIPENAPFSEEQRSWLNGFLAGMFSSAPDGQTPAVAEEKNPELSILFGSQTGNAENLAKQTGKLATKKGFTPQVKDLETVTPTEIAAMERVLVITSTYGEGDPPDNAVAFHEALMADDAPKLENVSFSVLALGDSNYEDFCETGKEFDARFEALGAKRVHPRQDCDVDFDEPFEKWVADALDSMAEVKGSGQATTATAESVPAAEAPAELPYSKKNPYPAKLLNNYVLNKEGSKKEVRHIEISLEGSGVTYEAGDALGVYPVNCGDLVQEMCALLGFDGEEAVQINDAEFTLRKAMLEELDIRNLTKSFIKAYHEITNNSEITALLGDKEKLEAYIWGREIIDLLVDHPHKFASAQDFVGLLKNLQPRLYSISSSPKAHQGEVHLTVGAVRYESHGRERKGLCSTYLADRVGEEDSVRVYAAPNKVFKLPADLSLPVIMVGPGTGIAPFRAFLEERQGTQATGKNWLLFGDQHAATDFLYEEQLEEMKKAGYLHRLDVAFSRDQEKKIYVQDRMREADQDLWKWLEAGAYFYVCGDASRMAKDVDQALHDVIISAGGKSAEEAAAYVKQLKKDKRYVRDVY